MIGVQKLIDTYWVKFNDLDVECVCRGRDCGKDSKCAEYVVKFIKINRKLENSLKEIDSTIKKLNTGMSKECDQLKRSITKIKGLKL